MNISFFNAPQPVGRLSAVFLLALLVFLGLRFEPEPLVRSKLAEIAAASAIQFHADRINVHGWAVALTDVAIVSSRIPGSLIFERIEISPAWRALLRGDRGVKIDLLWQGERLAATVIDAGEHIRLEGIEAHAALNGMAGKMGLPLPVELSGDMSLQGSVSLHALSGLPDQGMLELQWQGAKAGMAGAEFALGNLLLQLEGKTDQWHWLLADHGGGFVRGNGVVDKRGAAMKLWPLSGTIVVDLAKADPGLLAWLPHSKGREEIRLNVSGTLFRPRVDVVK